MWVRTPEWEHRHEVAEVDLELLLAYRLQQNWKGRVRLLTAVASEEEKGPVMAELKRLVDLARIPRSEVYALVGDLGTSVGRSPQADVNMFGLPDDIDFDWAQRMVQNTRSTCPFVQGSGAESAVA